MHWNTLPLANNSPSQHSPLQHCHCEAAVERRMFTALHAAAVAVVAAGEAAARHHAWSSENIVPAELCTSTGPAAGGTRVSPSSSVCGVCRGRHVTVRVEATSPFQVVKCLFKLVTVGRALEHTIPTRPHAAILFAAHHSCTGADSRCHNLDSFFELVAMYCTEVLLLILGGVVAPSRGRCDFMLHTAVACYCRHKRHTALVLCCPCASVSVPVTALL